MAILGALAVTGKDCKNTFVDCYLTEWTILIVEITYFLGRLSAFPIMVEIGRTRLLELYFGTVTKKHFNIFNVCFMVFASIICILSSKLPLSILMSLVGAIFGFFFIYLIPTKFHFGCLYKKGHGKEPVVSESLISEE